jgi:hypothetical protein
MGTVKDNKQNDLLTEAVFVSLLRDALYVDSVGSLVGLLDFECDRIAFAKVIELDTDQGLAMEEEILLLAFCTDEAEASVGEFLDDTVHRVCSVTYKWQIASL